MVLCWAVEGHRILGGNLIGCDGQRRWACTASFATPLGLKSLSFLIFTLLRESQQRISPGVPADPGHPADLYWFREGLAISAGLCPRCWFLFDIVKTQNWSARILAIGVWNWTKMLLLNTNSWKVFGSSSCRWSCELNCWYPDNADWTCSKELYLNRSNFLIS